MILTQLDLTASSRQIFEEKGKENCLVYVLLGGLAKHPGLIH